MPKISASLWYDTQAKEAAEFYTSVFPGSKILSSTSIEGTPSGSVDIVIVELLGYEFTLFSAGPAFKFNEAVSFVVTCKDQAEVDYYWEKLSAVPEAEQCGWLKDKFGLSWQIVPVEMNEMMSKGTKEQLGRVTQAFLPMKKIDLAELKRVYKD